MHLSNNMERFSGYDSHGMTEPRYGAVVGYSAFSESYASKTEQLIEYGGLAGKPYKDGEIHQLLQPAWNTSPHNRLKKADKSSPRVRPGSAWNNVHADNSPPSKIHSGKYNNFSSDESEDDDDRDDVVCDKNGYCYPKPKRAEIYDAGNDYAPYGYTTKKNPNSYKPKPSESGYATPPPQLYYEKAKPNGNDYTTPPPQPYYDTTPPPQSYYENGYNAPPQPYYEAPNNKPMVYKPLPNIKTRLDRSNKGTTESQLENMRISSPMSGGSQRSPFTSSPKSSHTSSPRSPYISSPRKDQAYRETIDAAEARRRYGGASVGAPVEQYKGTIDSQEAAKRYRGIFVKY